MMKRIEDVAQYCLMNKIPFKIEIKDGDYYWLETLTGDRKAPFRSASYHAKDKRLVLMADDPDFFEINAEILLQDKTAFI